MQFLGPTQFSIIPGYKGSTATAGYCTLDVAGTNKTLFVWDSLEVNNNLIVDTFAGGSQGNLLTSN